MLYHKWIKIEILFLTKGKIFNNFMYFLQNKVRDEIREVLGDENLEFDHLPKLKYTELVIKETLRLYPIAPMMVRETTGDIKLGEILFV